MDGRTDTYIRVRVEGQAEGLQMRVIMRTHQMHAWTDGRTDGSCAQEHAPSPPRHAHRYGLAIVLQAADKLIWSVGHVLCGHTLKHLAVNGTIWTLHCMLHGRRRLGIAGQPLPATCSDYAAAATTHSPAGEGGDGGELPTVNPLASS